MYFHGVCSHQKKVRALVECCDSLEILGLGKRIGDTSFRLLQWLICFCVQYTEAAWPSLHLYCR